MQKLHLTKRYIPLLILEPLKEAPTPLRSFHGFGLGRMAPNMLWKTYRKDHCADGNGSLDLLYYKATCGILCTRTIFIGSLSKVKLRGKLNPIFLLPSRRTETASSCVNYGLASAMTSPVWLSTITPGCQTS